MKTLILKLDFNEEGDHRERRRDKVKKLHLDFDCFVFHGGNDVQEYFPLAMPFHYDDGVDKFHYWINAT